MHKSTAHIILIIMSLVPALSLTSCPQGSKQKGADQSEIISLSRATAEDGELTPEYIHMNNSLFCNVVFSIELQIYQDEFEPIDLTDAKRFGILRIPQQSNLQLSYSFTDQGAGSIALLDTERRYLWEDKLTRERINRWVDERKAEFARIDSTTNVSFDEWLRVDQVNNALQLYIRFMSDGYYDGYLSKETGVEYALHNMAPVWGLIVEPGLPETLNVEYEIWPGGSQIEYRLTYKDLVIERGGQLSAVPEEEDNENSIKGVISYEPNDE